MKICSIIGTRPQFIKAVLISQKLQKLIGVEEIIINTNQHFDANMSDVFFTELKIPVPKYNLGINCQSHAQMTANMMIEIEKIFLIERPDKVIVYGDCDTTLAGALVAAKMHIFLVHIESGLRSFDKRMPEEINRIMVDHLSNLLFCPTTNAITNLKNEGIVNENKVILTGDLMLELLELNKNHVCSIADEILNRYKLTKSGYMLMTIHRAASTTPEILMKIIEMVSRARLQVICPIHPRTRNIIIDNKLRLPKNLLLIDPVSYMDMMALIYGSWMVITDSGGLQKEAYAWSKYCCTLRNTTEWTETMTNNRNILLDPVALTVSELVKGISSQDHRTHISIKSCENWNIGKENNENTSDEIIQHIITL